MNTEKRNTVTYQGKAFNIELRYTATGIPVCSMRMSVNRKDKKTDEWQSAWFTVTAWREAAEELAKCNDRDEVIVHGRLDVQRGFTRRDGTTVEPSMAITAENVQRVDDPSARPSSQPEQIDYADVSQVPF